MTSRALLRRAGRHGGKLGLHELGELAVPGEITVITLVRQGKGLIPFPGAAFQEGDVVYLAVLTSAMTKLKKMIGWA